jgi:hypothetical protein
MNRQRLILFILVILFGIAAIWSYSALPRQKTVGTLANKPVKQVKPAPAVANTPAREADDGTRLKISLLDKELSGFKGYRRNIFKPVFVDELKVIKKQAVVFRPPPPIVMAAPIQSAMILPETAPLARFTFLGFLKKGSVKTIFLANDKDILLVKKGDTVAGRYEATEISDQALTLTVTDTGDRIVIPLIENQPLAVGN